MLFSPLRVGCTRAMRGFCVMHAFTRVCLYVCVSCSRSTMYTETMVLITVLITVFMSCSVGTRSVYKLAVRLV